MIRQLIPLPVRVGFWAVLATSVVLGGLWALDEYGDRRVETYKQGRDREDEAKRVALENAAREAGEAAAAARAPAAQPGATLRLKANWCRDCVEAR